MENEGCHKRGAGASGLVKPDPASRGPRCPLAPFGSIDRVQSSSVVIALDRQVGVERVGTPFISLHVLGSDILPGSILNE